MATIKVNKDDKWINILAGSSSYTKEEIDKALTNVNKTIVTNIENSKTEINNNISTLSTNIDTKIEDTKTSLTDELDKKANKEDVYNRDVLYNKYMLDDVLTRIRNEAISRTDNLDKKISALDTKVDDNKTSLTNEINSVRSDLSKYAVVERLGLKDVTYNYNLKTNDVSEYSKIKRRHMNWNIDFKDREDKYHHFQFNVTAGKDIVINVEGTQEQDIRYTFTDGSSFCIKLIFKLKKLIPVGKNVSILERETIRPEMFIANNNELPDTVKHTFLDNYNTDQVGTITVGIKTTYLDNTFDITYCRLTINSRNIELEDYSSITADGVYTLNIEKYYDTAPKLPNNDKARKLIIPAGITNLDKADFTGWTNLEELENNSGQWLSLSSIKDSKIKYLNNQKINFDYEPDCEIKKHIIKIAPYISTFDVKYDSNNSNINNTVKYFNKYLTNIKQTNILDISYLRDSSFQTISYMYNLDIFNKEILVIDFYRYFKRYLNIFNIYNTKLKNIIFLIDCNTTYGSITLHNIDTLNKLDLFFYKIYYSNNCNIYNLNNLQYLNIYLLDTAYNYSYSLLSGYIKFNTFSRLKQLTINYCINGYNWKYEYTDKNNLRYPPKCFENYIELEHVLYVNNSKLDTTTPEKIRNNYIPLPEIPFACFRGCVNLQEIIIMPSTKTIQTEAYTNCSSARYIHFIGTTPPTINGEPFKGVNCDMYVPDSAVETYKTAYPQYASRIKPDSTLVLTDEEKLYN